MTGSPVCRDSQLSLLSLYLGLEDGESRAAESLVVQGVEGTGKTLTLTHLLAQHKPSVTSAFVDCIEAYQPKLLYQSIIDQLGLADDMDVKCDNVSDFIRIIGERVRGKAVIVLENAERLREDISLLSVMTRLQEVTKCNISTILETRLDWSKLRPPGDLLSPSKYNHQDAVRYLMISFSTDPFRSVQSGGTDEASGRLPRE